MRIEFPSRLLRAAAAGFVLMLGVTSGARATGFVIDGAQHLLGLQDGGGFFADASPTTFNASTQGQIGLGMLTAYQKSCEVSCNSAYLSSAIALGDAMLDPINHATVINPVQSNELYFDAANTNPIVWSQSTLFLQRLTQVTANGAYANFVQTQLWTKLAAGTYGNDPSATNPNAFSTTGGVGAAGWAAVAQTKCADYSPWCIAKPAVAAALSGQAAIAASLMAGVQNGLQVLNDPNSLIQNPNGLEVLALASAIWASQLTGITLNLGAGSVWFDTYGASNTAQLAAVLAALIDGSGGFPPGIYTGAPATDVETTGAAILALALTDAATYAPEIGDAFAFLQAQQAGSGCIQVDASTCDPGISGEVLQYYSEVYANAPGEPNGGDPVIRSTDQIVSGFYAPLPEPLTVGLFGIGLVGLVAMQRRRRAG